MSNFKSDVKTMTFLVTVMAIMEFTACSDENDFEWEVEHTTRGLVLGATADTYNINDKDFTADTWRQQDAIYLYDEEGRYKTDDLGREGYTLVNLPWWKGDKQTNLPNGFCDDITREISTPASCASSYMTWGYNDNTCPPTTSYAVWNLLKCEKESLVTPVNEHWTSDATNRQQLDWILTHLSPAN